MGRLQKKCDIWGEQGNTLSSGIHDPRGGHWSRDPEVAGRIGIRIQQIAPSTKIWGIVPLFLGGPGIALHVC
jgi:hypothetical protein